jgi:hypothetical protein
MKAVWLEKPSRSEDIDPNNINVPSVSKSRRALHRSGLSFVVVEAGRYRQIMPIEIKRKGSYV